MNVSNNQRYGNALITGCVLAVLTMTLHPAGGSWEHLLKISNIIMGTHAMALVAIAFVLIGISGLKKQLQQEEFYSGAAFIVSCIAIAAGMCAALVNGLVLPMFISHFKDSSPEILATAKTILIYNTSLNHAFDLVFIGGNCGAIILWSVAILKTKSFPAWTAYFGLLVSLSAIIAMAAGFVFVDLHGFTIFVFGYVSWVVVMGVLIKRLK